MSSEIKELFRLLTKYSRVMIFSTSEPPQYVGVQFIDRKMKDRFVNHNNNLKTKTSIQTVFLKKANVCYLLYICIEFNMLHVKIAE
jgi:hypothetical protein